MSEQGARVNVTLCILSDRPDHLRVLLACLHLQTYQDWHAVVLDQAQDPAVVVPLCQLDPRIRHHLVPRRGDWGQAVKYQAAVDCASTWVGFPNDDAYYCPRYLELMLQRATETRAELVYCDWVSAADAVGMPYTRYQGVPQIGQIDVGGFLVKRDVLVTHGWPDRGPTGDGVLIESLIRNGVSHVRVPAVCYVKN